MNFHGPLAYSIHCFHHKENIFPNCTLLLKLCPPYLKNKAHVSKKGQLWKISPKRIKKILLLLLRWPTSARKCQMQRFSKSHQVSLGCRAGWAAAGTLGGEAAARPVTARGAGTLVLRRRANSQAPHSVSPGSSWRCGCYPRSGCWESNGYVVRVRPQAPRWLLVSVKRDRGGCPGLSTRPLRGRTGVHPQRAPRGCSRCPAPSASGPFHPRPCRLSPFPPGPVLGTTNLPSLWICQFCRLHTNGILLSVLFCD